MNTAGRKLFNLTSGTHVSLTSTSGLLAIAVGHSETLPEAHTVAGIKQSNLGRRCDSPRGVECTLMSCLDRLIAYDAVFLKLLMSHDDVRKPMGSRSSTAGCGVLGAADRAGSLRRVPWTELSVGRSYKYTSL